MLRKEIFGLQSGALYMFCNLFERKARNAYTWGPARSGRPLVVQIDVDDDDIYTTFSVKSRNQKEGGDPLVVQERHCGYDYVARRMYGGSMCATLLEISVYVEQI